MDSVAVAAAHAAVPMMDPEVRLVAGIDSIMAHVAADPAKQAAYDQAVAPRPSAATSH